MSDVIQQFAAIAQPLLLARFGAASCVASTRVTMAVLRHLGLEVEPKAAWVAVFDPAAVATAATEGLTPQQLTAKPKQFQLAYKKRHPEHNCIVIGDIDKNGMPVAAHAVPIIERKYLLDLTIGQATDKQSGIEMPGTLFIDLPRSFYQDDAPEVWVPNINGTWVVYHMIPWSEFYREMPQWDKMRTRIIVEEILERLVPLVSRPVAPASLS